jgi:5-methylcytosine-specific restriction endonuclease McrA
MLKSLLQKRQCKQCHEWKSLDCFSRHKTCVGGVRHNCKSCESKNAYKLYLQKKANPDEYENIKQGRMLSKKENTAVNHIDRYLKNKLSPEWVAKHREWNRRYVDQNREKERERVRVKDNNRRAKMLESGGKFTTREWREMKKRYDYTCLRCRRMEPDIKLTIDHIKPINDGGRNDANNIQPLCVSCNSSKGARHIDYRP